MDVVLRNLTGEFCFVFIDDILVFADTIEEHARRLDKVLQRFDKANLLLQPGKCTFVLPQVNYLGYVVSRDGVTASPEKVRAVRKYPVPKNVKEVRTFLGLASLYRGLVPRFAEIAKPMTEMIRKDTQFKWETSQQTAFEKLKEVMFRTSPSIPKYQVTVHIDDRCIKGGRSRSFVTGPKWCRAPDRFCKPTDESGRAKLRCFRSRNARSNMGNKTVSLLPSWEAIQS
jgi:hypothetical protein